MKKISFSFTKSKPVPAKSKVESRKDIQFIDCIESNSIKVKGDAPSTTEEELVIPVKRDLGIRKEDSKGNCEETNESISTDGKSSNSTETLDAIAVREILEDSQKVKEKSPSTSARVLPAAAPGQVATAEESSLEDYDNIPVSDFGLAMLRGMGWKPEKGIGKTGKIVEPSFPALRPKGIGLGADKLKVVPTVSSDTSEDMTLKKGAYVQILSGPMKHMYGEVQSFDEDVGRVFIRTTLGRSNTSVNESMVQVVSKHEYQKSSRVLNQSKYEEYKRKEEGDDIGRKKHKKEDYKNRNGNR